MRTEKIYIANDGKEFRGVGAYADCTAYECQLQEVQHKPLYDFLTFGDYDGTPVLIAQVVRGDIKPYYLYIKKLPDPLKDSDEICTLFEDVLPYDFYGCEHKGKFVYTDNQWRDFEDIQQEFQNIQAGINRLCGQGG